MTTFYKEPKRLSNEPNGCSSYIIMMTTVIGDAVIFFRNSSNISVEEGAQRLGKSERALDMKKTNLINVSTRKSGNAIYCRTNNLRECE